MPVKDVKIYTGAAEGWVSIGDLSTLPISSTDGTVTLDSPSANTFTVSTGAFYLNVGNPTKNITIGDNTSGVAGGDGVYILSRTHDIAFSSDEIRFNSNWSGGAAEPTWVMTTDSGLVGNNQANYIKCGSVSGTGANNASIQLGAELLTNNHTPTQPNSIATKSYVDASAGAADVCSLTDVDCSALSLGRIMVCSEDGDSGDISFVFQDIGASSIGRPPLGSDWETNTIGWKFNNAGNLLMGESIGGPGEGTIASDDDAPILSNWQEGSIGYEIDSLRVLFEEGGGGSTPSLPPGENAGDQYSERSWSADAGIANNEYIFARDGVFSNGKEWSVDGLTWARAPRTVDFSVTGSIPPVKLTSQGTLYLSSDGTAFSYDMKSWYAVVPWITGNTSYGQRPLSTVFISGGSAYVYARYRSSFDISDPNQWRLRLLNFNPASGGFTQVLAGSSNHEDNLLAFLGDNDVRQGKFITFTTHESAGFVMGLQDNGTRVTRINSQGVGSAVSSLDARLPVESFTYDGSGLICAKLDNGTALSSDGIVFSSTSLFPQAGNYSPPSWDGVGRWHICGPAGQPLICYAEGNGTVLDWQLVSQEVPSGGSGEAYAISAAGRVIITQLLSDDYLLSGQVDGVYTVDVKLTQTSGEIRRLASPRLIIVNAETQEDANQIFVDRFQNTGNLLLGSPDSGGVWAAGTIGKALEDISGTEGPAGPDGKGWTGGSYNASNGIVTFTSDDGLGFATSDLRGAKGDSVKGDDGVSVDLTTVGVDMTDCDLTPDGANGAFTGDGTGADGTKKYKLDLNLPRGTVVTESSTQPNSTGLCVGDLWVNPTEGGDTGAGLKYWNGSEWISVGGGGEFGDPEEVGHLFAWINFNGATMTTRDKFNVSDVQKNGTGHYTILFDEDPATENYASAFGVGTTVGVGPTSVSPFAARTARTTTTEYEFVVCYANGNAAGRADLDYISILFFGKVVR